MLLWTTIDLWDLNFAFFSIFCGRKLLKMHQKTGVSAPPLQEKSYLCTKLVLVLHLKTLVGLKTAC